MVINVRILIILQFTVTENIHFVLMGILSLMNCLKAFLLLELRIQGGAHQIIIVI
jgi:hypothetical protein